MASVLEGVRVLDLSTIVAGPAASMILADLGADIIKVERPGEGEDGRAMGPHRGPWGAYFTTLNRGKRSVALDIRQPAGREAVLRIATTCDVFLENFRGGKAAALGLDEAAVRARKPDIIYASLSAYGARGPDYTRPGYDAILQARTGIMSVTGNGDEMPIRSGVSILDMGTGVWTALGVLAALLERQRSGKGQRVDTSLFQTGVMLLSYHLLYRQFAGVNPKPQGSRHTAFAPYGAFPASDGAIMIGISSDKAFLRLAEALGKPEWADDPRFRTNRDRVHNTPELDGCIAEVLRLHPVSHWTAVLDQHDVACDPVQTPEQVIADRQVTALGQLESIDLAGEQSALLPQLPVGFSLTPAAIQGPPPAVGQHTGAILKEAGYADAEIEDLLRSGVCEAVSA
ncbi:MAG TPA: CoA transferase [Bryobacteraceae bacterium]|jgi:crotonobetainyl-CoA:carnitine CoA-transferase CaiB-like acyl-CoA transferase|nr:CoA transferase [Bryobacteraceae bacterium]